MDSHQKESHRSIPHTSYGDACGSSMRIGNLSCSFACDRGTDRHTATLLLGTAGAAGARKVTVSNLRDTGSDVGFTSRLGGRDIRHCSRRSRPGRRWQQLVVKPSGLTLLHHLSVRLLTLLGLCSLTSSSLMHRATRNNVAL